MRKEDVIVESFFDQCCGLYSSKGWQASAWVSEENQRAMFQCLSLVGDLSEGTILDVGCGQGDLYDYLGRGEYTGIDISSQMISHAKSKRPGATFHKISLLDYNEHHDWVLIGGAFNIKISEDKEEQRKYLWALIEKAYDLADKGMTFSVLSDDIDIEQWPQLFYYKTAEILNMCLSLSRHVALDHITLPNQVVFYMPKISP